MGTGFSLSPIASDAPPPVAGNYVLQVATIDARKNQALMFRVWSRLLAADPTTPRLTTPRLVFAGKTGWMVEDLMQMLANTGNLDGHIVVLPHATDAELARLYQGCLFTVFPSFAEGWGLPVTESLSFGKPCIASRATAIPEAGGGLIRSFDPEDGNEAFRVIRDTLADRAGLAAWEADIARDFRSSSWDDTAAALLQTLSASWPA